MGGEVGGAEEVGGVVWEYKGSWNLVNWKIGWTTR